MLKTLAPFLIIIFVLAVIKALLGKSAQKAPTDFPYEKTDTLLTPAERSFFGVLEQALDGTARVFAKVRVGDILKVSRGLNRSKYTSALNRINMKHVDFVICKNDDLSILGAIELDDRSHQKTARKQRDTFIDQAFTAAQVPLLRIPAKQSYPIEEVSRLLSENFGLILKGEISEPPINETIDPVCPQCGEEMVKRKANKGQHAGKMFWACSTFPKCRQVVPI